MTTPSHVVGTPYSASAAATSHDVPLPSGVVGGSTLLGFLTARHSTTADTTWPSGWVMLVDDAPNSVPSGFLAVAYKRVGPGDPELSGSTVTVGLAESSRAAAVIIRLEGDHASTNPQASTPATGSDAGPDPANLAPVEGGVEDRLWFAATGAPAASSTTAPAGYTDDANVVTGSTSGTRACLHVAHLAATASSEDPGNFVSPVTQWVAVTVAVRPAAEGDATAFPVTVTAPASFPAATAAVSATPEAIAATVAFPASAPGSATTATPDAVAAAVSYPAATVTVSATVQPAAVAASVTLPAADTAVGAVVTPDTLTATTELPEAAAVQGAICTPGPILATFTAPPAGWSVAATATPGPLALSATFPAATVDIGTVPPYTPPPGGVTADQVAEVRDWVGSTPDDDVIEATWARKGTVAATALAILRARRADLLAGPTKWAVGNDYSQEHTAEALKAINAQIDQLEDRDDTDPTTGSDTAVSVSYLERCGAGR